MRGSVKSGVFEQLRDENKSGGLGKSSKEASESTVDADEESRERFGLWSKYGSGSGAEKGGGWVSVWSCAAWAADKQVEAGARCVAAGPPLQEQTEMAARGVEMLLEGSMVVVTGEIRAEKEGVGGS